jgi:hypothetical protein
VEKGLDAQAVGEEQPRARVEGRDRVSDAAGSTPYLDQLGFNLVGYGCTTCIGNSGPLPDEISAVIREKNLVVCSVLSGNRNFEGRIQQDVRANYLASPPLVVAYALAGWITKDLTTEPLGEDHAAIRCTSRTSGRPSRSCRRRCCARSRGDVPRSYATCSRATNAGRSCGAEGKPFEWDEESTYIRKPTFLEGHDDDAAGAAEITGARVLALLGDSVTTDHISPAGSIKADSPAGKYLIEKGVKPADFNSYGARRGNHEVMMRGTFANVRLRNQLAPGTEGGWTMYQPGGELMTIYDASVKYQANERAAARDRGQGVRVRIVARLGGEGDAAARRQGGHRRIVRAHSPQQSREHGRAAAAVQGRRDAGVARHHRHREFSLVGTATRLKPRGEMTVVATAGTERRRRSRSRRASTRRRRLVAFRHGGILPYVVRQLVRRTLSGIQRMQPQTPRSRWEFECEAGLELDCTILTRTRIKTRRGELGFDLCGIAPRRQLSRAVVPARMARSRLCRRHGVDAAIGRSRADVRTSCRARVVVVTGTLYNTGSSVLATIFPSTCARISRYAWGDDYHDVLKARMDALLAWMRASSPSRSRRAPTWTPGRCRSVSTRSIAGLGWIGKNTCLINPELGSWLFSARSSARSTLEPDTQGLEQCGSCTRCLEACPTARFVESGVLDSTRCIST